MSAKFSGTFGMPVLIGGALFLGLMGCRSKLSVRSESGGPQAGNVDSGTPSDDGATTDGNGVDNNDPGTVDGGDGSPVAAPVEQKNTVVSYDDRSYFQTRDTITLKIKKELLETATSFSVYNVTKADASGNGKVTLIEDESPELGLRSYSGFGLTAAAQDVIIHFYPASDSWKGKFFYDSSAPNVIRVVANHPTDPQYSDTKIYLRDFNIFTLALTAFETDVQLASLDGAEGYRFQGWVNQVGQSTVQAADGSKLTTGAFSIINGGH